MLLTPAPSHSARQALTPPSPALDPAKPELLSGLIGQVTLGTSENWAAQSRASITVVSAVHTGKEPCDWLGLQNGTGNGEPKPYLRDEKNKGIKGGGGLRIKGMRRSRKEENGRIDFLG